MSSLYEANSTQRIGGNRCCVLSPWVPTGMEDSFSSWQEGWPLMVHSWVPLWRIALHLKEVALSKVYIPSVEGAHNHKRIDVGVQNQDLCLSWNKSEGPIYLQNSSSDGLRWFLQWITFHLFRLLGLTSHQCYSWVCSLLNFCMESSESVSQGTQSVMASKRNS